MKKYANNYLQSLAVISAVMLVLFIATWVMMLTQWKNWITSEISDIAASYETLSRNHSPDSRAIQLLNEFSALRGWTQIVIFDNNGDIVTDIDDINNPVDAAAAKELFKTYTNEKSLAIITLNANGALSNYPVLCSGDRIVAIQPLYAASNTRSGSAMIIYSFNEPGNHIFKINMLYALVYIVMCLLIAGLYIHRMKKNVKPIVIITRELANARENRQSSSSEKEQELLQSSPEISQLALEAKLSSDNLRKTIALLEAANERYIRFTSDTAHQLRNPLQAIVFEAGSVFRESRDSKLQSGMGIILRNADRIDVTLSDLTELSLLDDPEYFSRNKKSPVNLCETVRVICVGLVANAVKYNVVFDVDCPAFILLDTIDKHASSVFENLINNAVKYSDEGQIVSVKMIMRESTAIFTVHNRGEYIRAEDKEKVFDRLFRASHTHLPNRPGSGLGLAIVSRICEHFEWKIDFESSATDGTTFTLTIPNVYSVEEALRRHNMTLAMLQESC